MKRGIMLLNHIKKEEEFDNVSDSGSIVSGSSKKSGRSSASKMSKTQKREHQKI